MSVYSDQELILQGFGCGGCYSELKNRVKQNHNWGGGWWWEGIVKHAPITENKGEFDKQR